MKHRPGGGEVKIFDDKSYIKQTAVQVVGTPTKSQVNRFHRFLITLPNVRVVYIVYASIMVYTCSTVAYLELNQGAIGSRILQTKPVEFCETKKMDFAQKNSIGAWCASLRTPPDNLF